MDEMCCGEASAVRLGCVTNRSSAVEQRGAEVTSVTLASTTGKGGVNKAREVRNQETGGAKARAAGGDGSSLKAGALWTR